MCARAKCRRAHLQAPRLLSGHCSATASLRKTREETLPGHFSRGQSSADKTHEKKHARARATYFLLSPADWMRRTHFRRANLILLASLRRFFAFFFFFFRASPSSSLSPSRDTLGFMSSRLRNRQNRSACKITTVTFTGLRSGFLAMDSRSWLGSDQFFVVAP